MDKLILKDKEGKCVTTSQIVADVFGKEHKNVLADIKNLSCSEQFRELNFQPSSYFSLQGKRLPMFEITKDGFSFLVMGYTGEKAGQFKEKFINAFNQMETQLKTLSTPKFESPEMLLQAVQMLVDQNRKTKELEGRVDVIEQKHPVNAELQHYAIMGYCAKIGRQISLTEAKQYGQKCSRLCTQMGFQTGKIPDPRFGTVKTYPLSVLEEIIGVS